jgi:ligand-binding SRPBCC domain-containing protein
MKTFQNEFEVCSNIDRVWEFYTDLKHLEIISPTDIKLNLVECTDRRLKKGTVVCFDGNIIIGVRWCSRITFLEKYEYVDEMIHDGNKKPPIRLWSHRHIFELIDDNKTRVVDKIKFELPFGLIGKLLEFYFETKLQKIFEHRVHATKKFLEGPDLSLL